LPAKEEDHDESDPRIREAHMRGSVGLRRGWYPVIGAGTFILLFFVFSLIVRSSTYAYLFIPGFLLAVFGVIFGTAFVMKTLLTEEQ
jgi:hypothetical protein